MVCLDTSPAPSGQGLSTSKLRWRTSKSGNRCLSFHKLVVTVFPNKRRSAWTVSVSRSDEPPTYTNHDTETAARAFAEDAFRRLKTISPPPVSRKIDLSGALYADGHLRIEYENIFMELIGCREREGERADLFQLSLEDYVPGTSFWVPHSQGKVVREEHGQCRLIVSRWWLDRATPAGD